MQRIDHATAAPALPSPQPLGTPGYFAHAPAGSGVTPTVLTEDWANMVQEELVAVILAAGITLDKANNAQVLAAIQKIAQTLNLSGAITPSQITSNQNDYNPTGYAGATVLRLSTDVSRTMTGLAAPSSDGGIKILRNVGSADLVLSNQDSGSAAANRFSFGVTRTLAAGRSIMLVYDLTSARWLDLIAGRKATTAEVLAGANDEAFVTAAGLKAAMATLVLTDAATINWDMSQGFRAKVTLGGNRTLGQPTNLQEGMTGSLQVLQDGTGSRTLAYASCWNFQGYASAPALSTGAGKRDKLVFEVVDAVTPVIDVYLQKSA